MKKISYDKTCGMVDLALYSTMIADDNRQQIGRLKRNLVHALKEDVTPRQREYMLLYYGKGMNMAEIGEKFGVNKSTVSRTLKRGRQRLYRCLRYGASNLLEQANS